jgi:hypothetical protein
MVSAPQNIWRWPPAIMSMKDLFDAMKAGFSLHVTYTDRGNAVYRMSRGAIPAPIGILQQVIAHRAFINGNFIRGDKLPDGYHLLTLKPKVRKART